MLCLVFQVQPRVQQVAVVVATGVIGDFSDVGFHRFTLCFGLQAALVEIRVATLVAVFVVDVQVHLPVVRGEVDGADASACRLPLVRFLVPHRVAEESSLIIVEPSGGKGEPFRKAVIVGQRGIIGIVRTCPHAEVRPLVGEGGFGVHLNQSAHGIAPVERALRTAQHVDALYVGIAEVEG